MVLGQGNTPFVPVITPAAYDQSTLVTPLFGETTTEEDLLAKRDEAFRLQEEAERKNLKKRFLLFGIGGVAIGSVVAGGMTALSLRSYERTGSVVGPAIYVGVGSAAMGIAMILLRARAVEGREVDQRLAALAVGASVAG